MQLIIQNHCVAPCMMPSPSAVSIFVLLSSTVIACTQSLSVTPSTRTTATSSIRIGTRSSKLALTQAQKFQNALQDSARISRGSQSVKTEIVPIDATGDQGSKIPIQQLPLAVNGVDFTGALDEAVLNGSVDVAVHSLKDIPRPSCRWNKDSGGKGNTHLIIGAYLGPRATPLDVLITRNGSVNSIHTLPQGATVGSASIRRQAQLKAIRPDLNVINLRGNVDSRLRALDNDEVDALVLALAGLKRLGIFDGEDNVSVGSEAVKQNMKYHYNPIPIETILPGLGQGVIAITCRNDNSEILSLLKGVDDHEARTAATTERAFLDTMQKLSPWVGRPPVAGYMRYSEKSAEWLFDGLLATPDGAQVLRVQDALKDNYRCNEETAQTLGRMAGEEVAEMAGDGFLDGYY